MCKAGLEVILSVGPLPNCSLSFPILGMDKTVLFYFILKKIYLFIYLFLATLGLSCGMQDLLLLRAGSLLQCTGFSLVVAHELSSCGAGLVALWHVGS